MLASRRQAEKILGLSTREINNKMNNGEIKVTKPGHTFKIEIPDEVYAKYTATQPKTDVKPEKAAQAPAETAKPAETQAKVPEMPPTAADRTYKCDKCGAGPFTSLEKANHVRNSPGCKIQK